MRIVHVSYDYIPFEDPHKWMQAIPFFTGIVTYMARRQETFSVHCINYEGVIEYEKASFYFVKGSKKQKLFPLKVNRQVQKLNPDVVIVHGFHFLWSILWLRVFVGSPVKIFIQHHAEKPFQFPKKYLQLLVDKIVTGYFFAAADLAAPWTETGLIKKRSKIYEVTEATSAFRPMNRIQAQARTHVHGLRTYLWVGRFDVNKDPLTLIKAFLSFAKHHSDVRLYVIYQQDDLLGEVRALLTDYATQIILVGKIPHLELVYWFNSVDFIISTSHYESGGIAVCEGMSCGCIPILSDIPSFRKMADGGRCGFLFTPGNAKSLLDVLEKSYEISIAKERRKVLEQFEKQLSFQAIAEKMVAAAVNANK
jgi:glycosyltransferase involved in cell wall biosynthesis